MTFCDQLINLNYGCLYLYHSERIAHYVTINKLVSSQRSQHSGKRMLYQLLIS